MAFKPYVHILGIYVDRLGTTEVFNKRNYNPYTDEMTAKSTVTEANG